VLSITRKTTLPLRPITGRFAGADAARAAVALIAMLVRRLTAYVGLINVNNATKLVEILFDQRRANAMAHIPSGLVGTETKAAVNLPRAHALFAGQQQMDDAKPHPQIDIRVLKNGPSNVGEPIAAIAAIRALPFEFHGPERIRPVRAAARANHAVRPAARHQIGVAGFLIGKRRVELGNGHLDNLFRLLPGHDDSPIDKGEHRMSKSIRQVRDHRLVGEGWAEGARPIVRP
jgi:hypothetical protein